MKKPRAPRNQTKIEIKEAATAQDETGRLRDERRLKADQAYRRAAKEVEWMGSQVQYSCAPIWVLVRLGNLVAATLADAVNQTPEQARYVACATLSWPVSVSDRPNLANELKTLLKNLGLGLHAGHGYDAIRAERWKSPVKTLAIELLKIIASVKHFHSINGEVRFLREYQRETAVARYLGFRMNAYTEVKKQMVTLAKTLGIEMPFSTDRELARYLFTMCLPGRSGVANIDKRNQAAVGLLWKLTKNHPEECTSLTSKIARSKAAVYKRTHGREAERTRAANIRAGIKGELRQALAHL